MEQSFSPITKTKYMYIFPFIFAFFTSSCLSNFSFWFSFYLFFLTLKSILISRSQNKNYSSQMVKSGRGLLFLHSRHIFYCLSFISKIHEDCTWKIHHTSLYFRDIWYNPHKIRINMLIFHFRY